MRSRLLLLALPFALLVAACGGSSAPESTGDDGGVRLVQPADADALLGDDVVVLDIRTPEEFQAGHVADAIMIDFYADDFADQLAELDRDATYVMYCRSGNRSAQAAETMTNLGFTDVAEIDGGVIAWDDAGYDLVVP